MGSKRKTDLLFVFPTPCTNFAQGIRDMNNLLTLSTQTELMRISAHCIVFITSDGNYSTLMQLDCNSRMLPYQLGQIEKQMDKQLKNHSFLRVGKSLIVNCDYINFINIAKQKLIMSDAATFTHTLTASKEALKKLKDFLDEEVAQQS